MILKNANVEVITQGTKTTGPGVQCTLVFKTPDNKEHECVYNGPMSDFGISFGTYDVIIKNKKIIRMRRKNYRP